MKTAKKDGSAAIWVKCPDCGGECEGTEHGSLMVTDQDETVTCTECWETFKTPRIDSARKKVGVR